MSENFGEYEVKSQETRPKIIAVDFDGTLCENEWPGIGGANLKLIVYLKQQRKQGAKIILWSCRSEEDLAKAVDWCYWAGLEFDAVNENLPEIIELFGRDTRKIFADEYIDDRANTEFELPYQK